MAHDFDSIAEEIIEECELDKNPWIIDPEFRKIEGVEHDWYILGKRIAEFTSHLDGENGFESVVLIWQVDANSDELTFVRNVAAMASPTTYDAHAAKMEFINLVMDSMLVLIVRKLRQLVAAQ